MTPRHLWTTSKLHWSSDGSLNEVSLRADSRYDITCFPAFRACSGVNRSLLLITGMVRLNLLSCGTPGKPWSCVWWTVVGAERGEGEVAAAAVASFEWRPPCAIEELTVAVSE